MKGWIDLTHMDSIYAFACDQYADKCDFDMMLRMKFMNELMKRNANDRQIRVNYGELLYEMTPEPSKLSEDNQENEDYNEQCHVRQKSKFNYVSKHKGKAAPKAKQLSDVYFEEQLMSDTYDNFRAF